MEHIGTVLWEMRCARGWTLGALARAAGVDKSAISRWEAGKRQPRMPELEAVLTALEATDAQRAVLLSHIATPRAVQLTRRMAVAMGLFAPPIGGDLLRAMRWRIQWSEGRLAARLGVDRTTIAHWENGHRLPSGEQLQALCDALEASTEEAVALATRRIAHGSGPNGAGPALRAMSLSDCLERLAQPPPPGLEDLHYLMLERDIWELAVTRPAAVPLLARAYVYHGHHHRMAERWAASRQPATKGLALALEHPEDRVTLSRAVLLSAAVAVFGRHTPAPEHGIRILRERMNWEAAAPEFVAWALSDMAKYLALAGDAPAGLPLASEAVRLVAEHENATEPFLRRCDLAEILLESGDADAALLTLPEPAEWWSPDSRALAMLLLAEACYRVGRSSESHDWLASALSLIETHGLRHLACRADLLALRF